MRASDFRAKARQSLKGNWGKAILTYFVASLLGVNTVLTGMNGGGGGGGSSNSSSNSGGSGSFGASEEELMIFFGILMIILGIVLVMSLALSLPRGALQLGYARFNLKLVDGEDARFGDLFSRFNRFGAAFLMDFLVGLFTFLWSLLFIVPGIIKSYSYSMSSFVMLENPHLSATEAITESRRLMDGNKWRLYCLRLSFIGWELLIILPLFIPIVVTGVAAGLYSYSYDETWLGIAIVALLFLIGAILLTSAGTLFLAPYQNAAYAAFYRRICEEKNPTSAPQQDMNYPPQNNYLPQNQPYVYNPSGNNSL